MAWLMTILARKPTWQRLCARGIRYSRVRARTPQPSHGDHSDHSDTAHGPVASAGSGSYSETALQKLSLCTHKYITLYDVHSLGFINKVSIFFSSHWIIKCLPYVAKPALVYQTRFVPAMPSRSIAAAIVRKRSAASFSIGSCREHVMALPRCSTQPACNTARAPFAPCMQSTSPTAVTATRFLIVACI